MNVSKVRENSLPKPNCWPFWLKCLVAVAMACGLAVRVALQNHRAFVDDEVGTLIFANKPFEFILTHYSTWLSMNYYIAFIKGLISIFGVNAWALTTPSLLSGVLVIGLVAAIGFRLAGEKVAAVAAVLTAGSVPLIEYSCKIRSYSILTLLSAAAFLAYLRWREAGAGSRSWTRGCVVGLLVFLTALSHLCGIYVGIFIGCAALWEAWGAYRSGRPLSRVIGESLTLLVPLVAAGIGTIATMIPYFSELRAVNQQFTDHFPGRIDYLFAVFQLYFGWNALVLPALLVFSVAVVAMIRHPDRRWLLLAAFVTPVIMMCIQGVSHFPWAYGRFLHNVLPFLIIVLAIGVVRLCEGLARGQSIALVVLTIGLLTCQIPPLRDAFQIKEKCPWARVANYLHQQVNAGDIIVPDDSCYLSLTPFFLNATDQAKWVRFDQLLATPPGQAVTRLVYVTKNRPIKSAAPRKTFGEISLVTYSGDNLTELLKSLRADLERTTHNETQIDLADHYQTLMRIAYWQADTFGVAQFTAAFEKSQFYKSRRRFALPQKLRKESELDWETFH